MAIEFDPEMDKVNLDRHGISLAAAQKFDWNTLLVKLDTRRDYGEGEMKDYEKAQAYQEHSS